MNAEILPRHQQRLADLLNQIFEGEIVFRACYFGGNNGPVTDIALQIIANADAAARDSQIPTEWPKLAALICPDEGAST